MNALGFRVMVRCSAMSRVKPATPRYRRLSLHEPELRKDIRYAFSLHLDVGLEGVASEILVVPAIGLENFLPALVT